MEKIKRDTFLYMEPPEGYYRPEAFANCETCRKYVPQDYAKTGNLCIELGPDPKIGDDWSCCLYSWWPLLKPNPVVIKDHLVEIQDARKKGASDFVSPKVAGLVHRQVRCENCGYFDEPDSDCELFEMLNEKFPEYFDLDEKVKPLACCNAQTAKGTKVSDGSLMRPTVPGRYRSSMERA